MNHQRGIDVLGAESDRFITIRLTDPKAVARAEGGVAKLAADWLPDIVAPKVYEEAAHQIRQALKEKKVDATVAVSTGAAPTELADDTEEARLLTTGAILGATIVGGGYFLSKFLFGKKG